MRDQRPLLIFANVLNGTLKNFKKLSKKLCTRNYYNISKPVSSVV